MIEKLTLEEFEILKKEMMDFSKKIEEDLVPVLKEMSGKE